MLAVSGVLLVSATKLPRLGCDASGPCVRSTCLCIHSRRWTHSFAAYDTWPYCARDMYVNPRAYYVAPCSLHVFRALCCVSSSSITHALPEGASLCVVSPVAWYSSQAGTGSRQRRDRDVSRVACLRTGRGGPHLHETALSRSERTPPGNFGIFRFGQGCGCWRQGIDVEMEAQEEQCQTMQCGDKEALASHS